MEAFKRNSEIQRNNNNSHLNRSRSSRNPFTGLAIDLPQPNVVPLDMDVSLITYSRAVAAGGGMRSPPIDSENFYRHQFNKLPSPRGSPLSPLLSIENLQTPPSRSPPVFISPRKVEEDVFVMDGIMVGSSPGGRVSSPSAMSGNFKTDISRRFDSGSGRHGSNFQYAHGKEEQRPKPINSIQSRPQAHSSLKMVCNTFAATGSCIYGARCHYSHSVSAAQPNSLTKFKALGRPSHVDWSPVDDGIEVHLPLSSTDQVAPTREAVNAYINNIIRCPPQKKRLPIFTQICPR
ncbi:hypothetical protein GIB67_022606 [Kingdonia uniflora]|uniref:C3H1-type domain-containing protein n=1 Tax=Kingdonia uniflora TaxID=39325 RepID=A0A7J7P8Y3_9MAGN|nr:hypothetical protein GIB67_022606 [Kingdonia uniflora]